MFKKVSQILKFNQILQESTEKFRVLIVNEEGYLGKAKRLHAKVYLKHGYVKPTDLTDDGLYIGRVEDPYQDHAQYFAVEAIGGPEPQVVSAARLILKHQDKAHDSFQTYLHQVLYEKYKAEIEQLNPAECAEVSGLVKDSGVDTLAVFMLYRTMWQYSVEHGYKTWLMSCDARLYRRLKLLFGGTLRRIGPNRHFKGHEVVPIILDTEQLLDYLLKSRSINPIRRRVRRTLIAFFLADLDANTLSPQRQIKLQALKLNAAHLSQPTKKP